MRAPARTIQAKTEWPRALPEWPRSMTAIKTRIKERAAGLIPFFDAGAIGEGSDGFVAVRDVAAELDASIRDVVGRDDEVMR